MGFNYGNMDEATKQAEKNEANKGRALDEGDFKVAFREGEYTKTKTSNLDVMVLEWKVNAPDNDWMHRKKIMQRFIIDKKCQWQHDRFLILMKNLGVKLGSIKSDKDWDDVFEALAEARTKAVLRVFFQDSDKEEDGSIRPKAYPEFRVQNIIKGLEDGDDYAIKGGYKTMQPGEDTATDDPADEIPMDKPEPKKESTEEEDPKASEAAPEAAQEKAAETSKTSPEDTEDDDSWD